MLVLLINHTKSLQCLDTFPGSLEQHISYICQSFFSSTEITVFSLTHRVRNGLLKCDYLGKAQQGTEKETISKITYASLKFQNYNSNGIFFSDFDSHMSAVNDFFTLSLAH